MQRYTGFLKQAWHGLPAVRWPERGVVLPRISGDEKEVENVQLLWGWRSQSWDFRWEEQWLGSKAFCSKCERVNPKEKATAWDILIALISEHDIATSLKTKNTSAFIQGRLTTLFSCPQPPMPHRFFLSTLKHLCLYKIQPFLCGFFCLPWPAVAVGCFQSAQELLVTEFGNHFTLCPPKLPKEVLCLPEEAVCAELLSCRSTAWCLTTLKETTVTSHYLKSAGQTLGVFLFKKWNSFPCMENETYSVSQSFLERSVK